MRTRLFLLSLFYLALLLLLPVQAGAKEPLYIVDGKVGVSQEQIPPVDSIASISVVDSADAVYSYGQKASGGAIIMHTKAYMRHLSDPTSDTEDRLIIQALEEYGKAQQEARKKQRWKDLGYMVLLFLIICAIPSSWGKRLYERWEGGRSSGGKQMSDEEYRLFAQEGSTPTMPESLLSRGFDPLFAEATLYVIGTERASSEALQGYFRITKKRANLLIKQLIAEGIISKEEEDGLHQLLYVDYAELVPVFDKLGIEWNA